MCENNFSRILMYIFHVLSPFYLPGKKLIFVRLQIFLHAGCNFLHPEELSPRWVSVVEFHDQALSIGKVFGQESTVVEWNYQILSLHLVTVCQKVPILDFQSEFSMSKIIRIFLKKNSLKNINLGTPFCKKYICWLQFLNHFITKVTPNFWRTITWWRRKIW